MWSEKWSEPPSGSLWSASVGTPGPSRAQVRSSSAPGVCWQTPHFAFCWSHRAHLFARWGTCDFLLYLSPKTQAMKDVHCLGNGHSHLPQWKRALGSLLTAPWPGHRKGLLWEERTAPRRQATHWHSIEGVGQMLPVPDPVLKTEQRSARPRLPGVQGRDSGCHTSLCVKGQSC